jgi:hypothetical protein
MSKEKFKRKGFDWTEEFLSEVDWLHFLSECDCAPNGEEWLDRREPTRRKRGVWYYG